MTSLKERIAAPSEAPRTIADWIERQRGQIARALPQGMDADRFTRIALTQVRQSPQLAACSPQSMLAALMLAAQLGLEPGPLGQCYLSPRKIRGNLEVQFTLGYRGIVELAWRSEQISSIEARAVYEGDWFEFAYGIEDRLEHRPALTGRGAPVAYYGLARFVGGGHFFLVMSKDDIDRHRGMSDAGESEYGPWVNHYDAMARKTVIRQMAPYLPLTAASAAAIAQDESVHTDIEPDMADRAPVIDVTAEETPSVTEPDATAEQAAPLDDLDALAWADLKDRAFAAGIPTKGKNRAALTEALRNHTPETES